MQPCVLYGGAADDVGYAEACRTEPCWGLGPMGGVAAESLDSESRVSGKLGGVAGVLAGVHIELKWPAG